MSHVQWAKGWDEERFTRVLRERNGFEKCIDVATDDCVYNDNPEDPANGRTCALGAFIPPDAYDPEWESKGTNWCSAYDLVDAHPEWFPIVDGDLVGNAVSELQETHDAEKYGPWSEEAARKWAKEWVL